MFQRSFALTVILAFTTPIFTQVTDKKDAKGQAAELQKQGVAFLRETMSDVSNLRTLENRISFSAEMAGLMWFHDEREARSMFTTAIGDFRELIARLDAQMNAMPESADAEAMGIGLFADVTGRAKIEQKYRIAMAVRQQIASSIAEHDPDLALGFYYDTNSTNPKMHSSYGSETYFEFTLLGQIAEKNAAKAAQFGIKSVEKGLEQQHVELLRKIYEKDQEKGVEFGSALLSKAKFDKPKQEKLYALNSLLEFGSGNLESSAGGAGKRPIFSRSDLKELADVLANGVLDNDNGAGAGYVSMIAKYQPGRAAQIRAKLGSAAGDNNSVANRSSRRPSNALKTSANTVAAEDHTDNDNDVSAKESNSNSNSRASGETPDEMLDKSIEKLGKGGLPKEEREKAIGQARKILMQTRGRDKQVMGLSMLASQVAKAGDKELAAEIMKDAASLVNPNPKHYQDFIFTLMVAAGYAESDPEKAFPILEDTIGRVNDLIYSFVKIGEFIDVSEEMITDGEAQVGAFGGGMIRGLGKELGVAEATISTLVKADFAKTKALTNRFDRPEVRVLAKMLVLRSVLGKKAETPIVEATKTAVDLN